MDCPYNKYLNDLLYGNLKEEKKSELIRHAEGCSECSGKLRKIEEIDGIIKDVIGYSTYEDFRSRTIQAVEERKGSLFIQKIIYKSYKYVCAAAVVLIIAILAYSSGLFAGINNSTDNSGLGQGSSPQIMYDKVYKFDPPLTKTYDGVTVKVKEMEVLPHQVIATLMDNNNLLGFEVYDDQGNHVFSKLSSLYSASQDSYNSMIFEMFTLKSKYITIRPYCGYEPITIDSPREFPTVLTTGRGFSSLIKSDEFKETLTLTGIDYLPDKTVMHFEHDGYGIAECLGIQDAEGKSYTAFNNKSIISAQVGKEIYIQEYPPLPKDSSVKRITFYRIIDVSELAEQLEIKIPIGDDK